MAYKIVYPLIEHVYTPVDISYDEDAMTRSTPELWGSSYIIPKYALSEGL